MRSPFPGMDPYVEAHWNNVHGTLITYLKDDLNENLPSRYRAVMDERIVIGDSDDRVPGARVPDVAIIDWPEGSKNTATATHSTHYRLRSPELIRFEPVATPQYFVEIVDSKSDEKVVTSIEVLSPSNKRTGDGMNQFKTKQAQYRSGRVNRIEIDLLRDGERVFDFPFRVLEPGQVKPYYVVVYWGDRPNEAGIHAIDLRDPLPAIGVPLRPGEPEIPVALQPLLDRVYRNGRFPIDYAMPPEPPLDGDDAEWAAKFLAEV